MSFSEGSFSESFSITIVPEEEEELITLTSVDSIESAIVILLKTITQFDEHVWAALWHLWSNEEFPGIIVNLESDDIKPITLSINEHRLKWNIEVCFRGTGSPGDDWNSFKELIGLVVDKIDSEPTLYGSCSISKSGNKYFAHKQEESLVFYSCLIELNVLAYW